MKRLKLFMMCVTVGVLFPAVAFAQTGPAPGPTLSTPVAVTMILSLVLGLLTNIVQTGTVLGQWVTPKAWLPMFTLLATFLGGVVAYFTGLSPLVLDGASTFYAIASGVTALLTGAAPGAAIHVHTVLPQLAAQARARMRAPMQINAEEKTR
jgi:uncharacterized membrane protein YczE